MTPRNHLTVVKAILAKTVARGATKGEEEAAVAKAVEMMGKYHIPHSAVASVWPAGWDFQGKRAVRPTKSSSDRPRPRHDGDQTPFVMFWQHLSDLANKAGRPGPNYAEARRAWDRRTWDQTKKKEYKPEPGAKGSLGEYAKDLLRKNYPGIGPYPYEYIIKCIHDRYPGSKTTINSLRWYENQMRKSGVEIPAKRPTKA